MRRSRGMTCFAACLLTAADLAAQDFPRLAVQGSLMSGGWSRLTIEAPADIGDPVLLLGSLGYLPLEQPIVTGKGDWFLGDLLLVLPVGAVPGTGVVDVMFGVPPVDPSLYGTTIALQAYVAPSLSNPATLPLDEPYLNTANALKLTAPVPKLGATFGDTSCVGDFNGDGAKDIAVGSWFEDYLGIDKSGRVYLFWGPDFTSSTALQSDQPKVLGAFGASLNSADLDNDGVDDLVVAEKMGDPPPAGAFGRIHIFWGGAGFVTVPGLSLAGGTTFPESVSFGRNVTVADIDGDGWKDIAASVLNAVVLGQVDAGRIDVFWGPDFSASTSIISPDNGPSAFFGSDLAIGDVDGDGSLDLVESSGRDDVDGVNNAGSVHVFAGGGRALPIIATLTSPLPKFFNARFGGAVAVDDMDGDGMAELAVSEMSERPMIFWDLTGSNYTTMDKPPSVSTLPPSENVYSDFLSIGDVNFDGMPDVLISDYFDGLLTGCPIASTGVLYVALAPYFRTFLTITDPYQECGAEFSWRPTITEIDGDARLELVCPAQLDDEAGVINAGHVIVFELN
jgi:hypothetical protein